ncbi:hypothetical protein [Acinetobacter pittii]|uniref:hypothetical protein n=1 Tax=Acinetobacter pittii TaxID=48296 RepID=UPI0012988842|nr:hypothetical protein [Acinetobacter pittii]MRA47258.1 hypothetical protein [Acinetobacter pittii]
MNTNEFIKYHTLEIAKEIIEKAPLHASKVVYRNENSSIYFKKSKNGNVMSFNEYLGKFTYHRTSNCAWYAPEMIDLIELKNSIESVEIIELFESLATAKKVYQDGIGFHSVLIGGYEIPIERLKTAISDYEDIYINNVELQIQYGIPVMSNTKAGCVYFPYTSITIGIDLASGPDWTPPVSINGDS